MTSRRGFTLIEVICVVGLTGLLLSALGTMLSLHAQHIDRTQRVGTQSGVTLAALAQLEQDLLGLAVDVSTAVTPRSADSAIVPQSAILRGSATGFVCSSWSRCDGFATSGAVLPQVIAWQFVPRGGEQRVSLLSPSHRGRFETSAAGLVRLTVGSPQISSGERLHLDWTASEFETVRFQYLGPTGWREAWHDEAGEWPRAIRLDWSVRDADGAPHRGSRIFTLSPPSRSHGGHHARQ